MEKNYVEEKDRLSKILEVIEKHLEEARNNLKALELSSTKISFEDQKRGEHLQVNAKIAMADREIETLKRLMESPYFGRFDFTTSTGKSSNIYIGKYGLMDDGDILITDWRAPISSMYYDSEVGPAEYTSLSGIISGYITLKRQIEIKKRELLSVTDTDLATNDELLKPYLNEITDNKMKIIIASIQKEQNKIIREEEATNLIVQGVAGSGKTSVALHRISYLLYLLSEKLKSNQFLVIGPNEYFLKYISSILPELETEPVNQISFLNLANDYLGEKISVRSASYDKSLDSIYRFKSSLEYKKAIDAFMQDYLKNRIIKEDFCVDGEVIISKEQIIDVLFTTDSYPNFQRVQAYFESRLNNEKEDIYTRLNEKYRSKYMALPMGDPHRNALIEQSSNLKNEIYKNLIKLFRAFIKRTIPNPTDIFNEFVDSVEMYTDALSAEEAKTFKEISKIDRKKTILFEDLSALLYVKFLLTNKKLDYVHVVVDEAQDYSLFHFNVLFAMMKNARFSFYGDLAQSVNSYRSISSWSELITLFPEYQFEQLNLGKSYRTTMEITNVANLVLEKLGMNLAEPVIRHGEDVKFIDTSNENVYGVYEELVSDFLQKGYNSIAIICKSEEEALKVYKKLKDRINLSYISSKDDSLDGNVFVLSSTSSKGLEFDATIINDASIKTYNVDDSLDLHLLYVALTRALHEEVILYSDTPVKIFDGAISKNITRSRDRKDN